MRASARGFGLVGVFGLVAALGLPNGAYGATAPGSPRNLSVVVTSVDRGTGIASMTVSFDAATTGGPVDHYEVSECAIPGGALSCPGGTFTSLPDVPAGPSHIVIPNVGCPDGAVTCSIRVRAADSTDTLFSNFKTASPSPWAPYAVTASQGPDAGQVTLHFQGPSESGAAGPGNRHYVAFVCTADCGSDASWSDSGLVIPYPPSGTAPFATPPYDCGSNVSCEFRMQYVDGGGSMSTLSGPVTAGTGPVLTIDQPAPGAVTNDPTVAGTCTVGDGTVTATIDPGAHVFTSPCSAGGTWSISIASLADAVYSASATQASSPLTAGPVSFTYDTTPPTTTDDTASHAGWHRGSVTVTLSPSDNLSGVAATYYTTDGSTPTTSSATGTSITLTADGVYTIKYFSVDNAGNTESVETASTPVMIDQTAPTLTFTPAHGASVGPSRYIAECAPEGVCGAASDATSGVATIGPATVRRLSDGFYWNGSAFRAAVANAPLVQSGNAWSIALPSTKLSDGVSYTVTVTASDVAGNSATSSATFTYDKTKPSPSSLATTNNDGTLAAGDSFSVTFTEPIDPASVPATTTLTMSRTGTTATKYALAGITNGALTTGATGYVTGAAGTRTITYNGSVSVSGSTITVTVTSGCTSGCAFVATGPSAGSFSYKAASTITDQAGNPTTAGGITSAPVVMF